jgi:hypothetical protein
MNLFEKLDVLKARLIYYREKVPVNNMGKWSRSVAIDSINEKITKLEFGIDVSIENSQNQESNMKIYQVDMRRGNNDYASMTLYLFSISEAKPSQSQINMCLKLIDENDSLHEQLNILGIDDGLEVDNFDFGFDQINSINANLIKSLEPDEIFYIIDAFDPSANMNNLLNDNGEIIIITRDGQLRYL